MAKDRYPGWWDVSVGGHVDPGEDYLTAAIREAGEELGLQAPELKLVCRRPASKLTGQEFVAVYAHHLKTPVAANPHEICGLAWVAIADLFERKPNGAPLWRVTGSGLESLRLWGVWAGWLR
jgi:8-oxo-dGTP pyrophosphatase MutT (NUDIX family)